MCWGEQSGVRSRCHRSQLPLPSLPSGDQLESRLPSLQAASHHTHAPSHLSPHLANLMAVSPPPTPLTLFPISSTNLASLKAVSPPSTPPPSPLSLPLSPHPLLFAAHLASLMAVSPPSTPVFMGSTLSYPNRRVMYSSYSPNTSVVVCRW